MLKIKRIYDEASEDDGYRILIDRVWPRGMKKENAHLDEWLKAIAPSTDLRKWFGHDPARWEEFKKRYKSELEEQPDLCDHIDDLQEQGTVTLVYGAKDTRHNNAVVLKEYLEERVAV